MTHGTITNNMTGQELTGEYRREDGIGYFDFRIDGTTMDNGLKVAEWTFTADKPPLPELPTKEGSVLNVTHWASTDVSGSLGYTLMLTRRGWVFACDVNKVYQADELRAFQERGKLEFEVVQ